MAKPDLYQTWRFNSLMSAAQTQLSMWRSSVRQRHALGYIDIARDMVIDALRYANRMGCKARKALCLKLLTWLRVARTQTHKRFA